MSSSTAKGIFFVNLTLVGLIVTFAVYQVPQPWRGILVAWLLFMGTAGLFILKVIRHLYAYRSLKLEKGQGSNRRSRRLSRDREREDRGQGLRVVTTTSSGGRYVVR